MREFMTKVSDYLSERREDPERREDRLSLAVIAAIAVVIVVLILLFWWGYTAHEKKEQEAAGKAKELQEQQSFENVQARKSMEEQAQALAAATYEEKMKEYMAQNAGGTLRQESMADTKALEEKVRELQSTMKTVEKELTKVVTERVERDTTQTETLHALESSVRKTAETISRMENRLADLSETMQTVNQEKIPQLQMQLKEVHTEAEQSRAEISDVRASVAALKSEDEKLWKELSAVERNLDKAVNENMKGIDSQLEKVTDQVEQVEQDMKAALQRMEEKDKKLENRMEAISRDALSYRYELGTNTLYLTPAEDGVKEVKP